MLGFSQTETDRYTADIGGLGLWESAYFCGYSVYFSGGMGMRKRSVYGYETDPNGLCFHRDVQTHFDHVANLESSNLCIFL